MDVGVVVGFFSPCDFKRPRQHAIATLEMLRQAVADVVFVQVVRTNQKPLPVPHGIHDIVLHSDDVMFFKENLWNIGAKYLTADKILFLDGDVRFCSPDWAQRVSTALDTCDVIQPFETAEWLDHSEKKLFERPSAFCAVMAGKMPFVHEYHPGFGLGMTRSAYDGLHGLYDLCVIGGGDTALIFAFARGAAVDKYLVDNAEDPTTMFGSPSYRKFRQNAQNLNLRYGAVRELRLQHLWHGTSQNRQYSERRNYFRNYWHFPDGYEAPVVRRHDGLLSWAVEQPLALEYFCSRKEDDLGRLPKKYPPVK
jgi:hypothetical protein